MPRARIELTSDWRFLLPSSFYICFTLTNFNKWPIASIAFAKMEMTRGMEMEKEGDGNS
jgi:hypothetical protein